MNNIRLSKNFTLKELLLSSMAIRLGREVVATEQEIENLRSLCVEILQPIRDELGPVYLLSGLRPLWLNTSVGGSKTSDHILGNAADFNLQAMNSYDACNSINTLLPHLPYKQMINEFGRWVHISRPNNWDEPKRQQLTAVKRNGETVYLNGIVK